MSALHKVCFPMLHWSQCLFKDMIRFFFGYVLYMKRVKDQLLFRENIFQISDSIKIATGRRQYNLFHVPSILIYFVPGFLCRRIRFIPNAHDLLSPLYMTSFVHKYERINPFFIRNVRIFERKVSSTLWKKLNYSAPICSLIVVEFLKK